jgi:hypothetical protein
MAVFFGSRSRYSLSIKLSIRFFTSAGCQVSQYQFRPRLSSTNREGMHGEGVGTIP